MYELPYVSIDELDPTWCLDQCYQIINTCPMFEKANKSGKFFRNYHTYRFYIDSELPIVKKFVEVIDNFSDIFCATYPNKEYYLGYVYLAHTIDSSEKICVWHKDKTYFDGQFHLTVKGNAKIKISIKEENKNYLFELKEKRKFDYETFKYLNKEHYIKKIRV